MILIPILLAAGLAGMLLALLPRGRSASNVAGTHAGHVTRLADAAIATRHLLVKTGSDADHVAVCGASDTPLGTLNDTPTAAGDHVDICLPGSAHSTLKMIASKAIAAGASVFTAAGGKVQDLPAAPGLYYCVGTTLTASAADGDTVEVDPTTATPWLVS